METKKNALSLLITVMMFITAASATAVLVQLEPITQDVVNYQYPDLNIFVNAYEENSMAYFQFSNESLIRSSVAAIYFDEDHFADVFSITESDDFAFNVGTAKPGELPQAGLFDPAFTTSISFGSEKPPYHQGLNPGEEMTIVFQLNDASRSQNWLVDFQTGELRIGAHVIGLPDGSSYPAVSTPLTTEVPEPATLTILGLGSMLLLTSKKKIRSAVAKTPKQLVMFVLIMTVAFAGNTHAMISDGNFEQVSVDDEIPYQITLLDVSQNNDDSIECFESDNISIDNSTTLEPSFELYDNSLYELLNDFGDVSFVPNYWETINLTKISTEANIFSMNN